MYFSGYLATWIGFMVPLIIANMATLSTWNSWLPECITFCISGLPKFMSDYYSWLPNAWLLVFLATWIPDLQDSSLPAFLLDFRLLVFLLDFSLLAFLQDFRLPVFLATWLPDNLYSISGNLDSIYLDNFSCFLEFKISVLQTTSYTCISAVFQTSSGYLDSRLHMCLAIWIPDHRYFWLFLFQTTCNSGYLHSKLLIFLVNCSTFPSVGTHVLSNFLQSIL